jgi:hypothetical protein
LALKQTAQPEQGRTPEKGGPLASRSAATDEGIRMGEESDRPFTGGRKPRELRAGRGCALHHNE